MSGHEVTLRPARVAASVSVSFCSASGDWLGLDYLLHR
jgi:hypothetical protein